MLKLECVLGLGYGLGLLLPCSLLVTVFCCSVVMKQASRAFRLTWVERDFLEGAMNEVMATVQKRDIKLCVERATKLITTNAKVHTQAVSVLRNVVMSRFAEKGQVLFRKMFNRHAGFKKLPKPLRGAALHAKATALALVERSMTVRIGTDIVREECEFAQTRIKQKMGDEVGRDCRRELIQRTKKKQCVERVIQKAARTGVADITQLWCDFSSSKRDLREVSLKAIKAVVKIKNVHVVDIHGLTVLFPFPIFQAVLELLTPSYIFAINMGEDAGIFDADHFKLLAHKIQDGTSAVRRWFVECHPNRRLTLIACGHVVNDNSNMFQLTRREDQNMWHK